MDTGAPATGGAPAGAPDVTGGSSSPTTGAPAPSAQAPRELTQRERLEQTIRKYREPPSGRDPQGRFARDAEGQPAPRPDDPAQAAQRPDEGGQVDGAAEPASAKGADDDVKEPAKEPGWLAKRLDRERAKLTERHTSERTALQGQVQANELRAAQAEEAARMLGEELMRMRERIATGQPWDARDDELAAARLRAEAMAKGQSLYSEHEQRIAQAREHAEIAATGERLGLEIDAAAAQFRLVSKRQIVDAMRADARLLNLPPAKVAAMLEAQERKRLADLGYAPAAPAPTAATQAMPGSAPANASRTPQSARMGTPGAQVKFGDSREDKLRLIASARGRNGS
jgi:hypothetical protein